MVSLPVQRAAVHADGRWCTWMYETRNETEPTFSGGIQMGRCLEVEQPRMNKNPEFLAGKRRRTHDPRVRPLNALVDRWNGDRLRVPYADPDSGGTHTSILFLHESPGPRASAEHGSGLVSTDNNDPSAERFWRLSRAAVPARVRHPPAGHSDLHIVALDRT
jgi:hypothetical protein